MENKKIWNLVWNTNILARDDDDIVDPYVVSYVYTDFEAAKKDALRVIERYVHSDNGLFDGEGGIPAFNKSIERMELSEEDDEVSEDGFDDDLFDDDFFGDRFSRPLNRGSVESFLDSLKKTIASGFKDLPESLNGDIDYLIKIDSSPERVFVEGIDDGPPCRINIDMFDMTDPDKDYCFEVNNAFDVWGVEDVKYFKLYLFNMTPNEEVDLDPFS